MKLVKNKTNARQGKIKAFTVYNCIEELKEWFVENVDRIISMRIRFFPNFLIPTFLDETVIVLEVLMVPVNLPLLNWLLRSSMQWFTGHLVELSMPQMKQ